MTMWHKTAVALGMLVIVLGVTRVRLQVDVLELLPQELKEVQGLRLFLDHFSRRDELILTLEHADPDILTEAREDLSAHLRSHPEMGTLVHADLWSESSPAALGEMAAWLLVNSTPPERFASLLEDLQAPRRRPLLEDSLDTIGASMELDRALTLAYDPYQLILRLRDQHEALLPGEASLSDDGTFQLLTLSHPDPSSAWVPSVKEAVRSWLAFTDVRVGFTGEPVFESEIATSMERDMKLSGITALLLTSILFALAYRRLRPLLALMAGLTLTFLLTLGLAGWLLDSVTVMSVGFAAILIGLTVDYGVLIYQTSLSEAQSASQLRQRTCQSILWAALTTAAAFAALGLSSVPGIAALGHLVAIGIIVGAVVMLLVYPPMVQNQHPHHSSKSNRLHYPGLTPVVAVLIGSLLLSALWLGLPKLDTTTAALRPRDSQAYDTMDRLETRLLGSQDRPLAIVATQNAAALGDDWQVPTALLPHASWQQANLANWRDAKVSGEALAEDAHAAGFEPEALTLTQEIIRHWDKWQSTAMPDRPEHPSVARLWSRLVATDGDTVYLLASSSAGTPLPEAPGVFPVSWPQITDRLNAIVPRDLLRVGAVLVLVVTVMLWLTFRQWPSVILTLSLSSITLTALSGAMQWLGWEWNFFSMSALLLTFGAGLDYSIHVLLAHRRCGECEDVLRALRVCALSSIAGFGSIAWASNQGLASLGRVCALALALNGLVCLILLPAWLRIRARVAP